MLVMRQLDNFADTHPIHTSRSDMNAFSSFCLRHLSKPKTDRIIYRLIRDLRPASIVEIGLHDGVRAGRIVQFASLTLGAPVRYTGIDLFEERPNSATEMLQLKLKGTYCQLRAAGGNVRLIPGDPFAALACNANELPNTDLLIISADQPQQSLQAAWSYVPRMLHEGSVVLVETADVGNSVTGYQRLGLHDLAGHTRVEYRRAA